VKTIYDLYMKSPPILTNGDRHIGSTTRNAFWMGFDGLRGNFDKTSFAYDAWKAGRDHRALSSCKLLTNTE